MFKKILLLGLPLFTLLGCTPNNSSSEYASELEKYQAGLVQKAHGTYTMTSSRNSNLDFEYCYLRIYDGNKIENKYKIKNEEEVIFKTSFGYKTFEYGIPQKDNVLGLSFVKYNEHIIEKGFHITLYFDKNDENPTIDFQSWGMTEKGYISYKFSKIN